MDAHRYLLERSAVAGVDDGSGNGPRLRQHGRGEHQKEDSDRQVVTHVPAMLQ